MLSDIGLPAALRTKSRRRDAPSDATITVELDETAREPTRLDVIFGPSVVVMDHGAAEAGAPAPSGGGRIRIEEDCWIGFGTKIVCEKGELVIGRHSVIAANSLINRSIPPFSVVAGDPARIVKQYDFSKGKWVLGCVRPAASADGPEPVPVAADSVLN
jgi:hypothetical protein